MDPDRTLTYGQPVLVEWIDSAFDVGWHHDAADRDLDPILTLGFVTATKERSLEVSATVGSVRGLLNPLSIPWGTIRKISRVDVPKIKRPPNEE